MMNGNTTPRAVASFFTSAHTRTNATQRNATQRNATQRKFKFICVMMLFLSHFFLFAQSSQVALSSYQRSFTPKSPEASAFNKYGDIGVSQFTGSPNISFPLSLSEEVPISLSYNASGNKPEEHHGWVGVGFNLNVGGMISRVKRGDIDEHKEYSNDAGIYKPYLENYTRLQSGSSPWNGEALLNQIINSGSQTALDLNTGSVEPDEFVFSFNNYSGSFLLNHDGEWIFRGNNPSAFKIINVNTKENELVYITNTLFTRLPRLIMGFTIAASDGTQYTFGGDESSVDFTYTSLVEHGAVEFYGYKSIFPMGWHLTKITPPSGKQIKFIYEKDGFQVLLNSARTIVSTLVSLTIGGNPFTGTGGVPIRNSLSLMRNAYLSEIQTPYEKIEFKRSILTSTDADDYPIETTALSLGSLLQIYNTYRVDLTQRKWFKLDSIKTYSKTVTPSLLTHYALEYNTKSQNTTRLQLKGIKQVDVNNYNYTVSPPPALNSTNSISVVDFEYNGNPLPPYGSGLIDHWGYYSNVSQSIFSPSPSSVEATYYATREPHPTHVKAEILKKMIYPTGGYTEFEFEQHVYSTSFSKVLPVTYPNDTAYSTPIITTDSTPLVAGGLRIKKITSYDCINCTPKLEKTYKYVKNYSSTQQTEVSSGILGGKPLYFDIFSGNIGAMTISHSSMNEQSLNPLNLTNGSPVTYSEVVEINKDNSYTIYKFSNADSSIYRNRTALNVKTLQGTSFINPSRDPIIDYEHARGRLLEQRIYTNADVLVQKTVNVYSDILDNSKAIRAVSVQGITVTASFQGSSGPLYTGIATEIRAVAYLIHTSPVFLIRTTTTNYFDNVAVPQTPLQVSIVTENTYDSRQNIITQTVKHLNDTETKSNVTTTFRYAYNSSNLTQLVRNPLVSESIETAGSQDSMLAKFMIGIPLVTVNNFNNGSKVEYKKLPNATVVVNGTTTTLTSLMPAIFYSLSKTASFNEEFRINGYINYDKPSETKEKGINTPVVTYDWKGGLLKSKIFGTGDNQLTWTYDYDSTKRLLRSKTDENGLRMKFTYDGYRRLATTYDRFSGTVASPQNVQTTTTYDYHYQGQTSTAATGDDVNRNFIGTTTTILNAINTTPLKAKQYLDGLGRPFMTYRHQYAPLATAPHQKTYVTYDNLGRPDRTYQPIANATAGVDGTLPATDYKSMTYEASPLSRVLAQTMEDGKAVTMEYGTNKSDVTEGVRKFTVTYGNNNVRTVTLNGYYAANTLFRTTSWDENKISGETERGKTDVFKDKLGRVLLTRKYVKNASNVYVNVDTYNVYDDFGDLVMVIPPGAIDANTSTITTSLVFEYTYNYERQLTEKKVPNAEPVRYYYNNKYLLALVQDGNMRLANKYLGTVYDEIGRVVKTGFVTSNNPNSITISDAVNDANRLTRTFYYPKTTWVKDQEAKVLKDNSVSTPRNHIWSYIQRRLTSTAYNGNPGWTAKQHLLSETFADGWDEMPDDAPITDSDYGGVNWTVSDYDGAQKPLYSINYLYSGPSWTPDQQVRQRHNFTYDNGQRLTQTNYAYALQGAGVNGNPTFILSNVTYNERDLLTEKRTAKTSNKYLQHTDFEYNKRNWLTSINKDFNNSSLDYPLFSSANGSSVPFYTSLANGNRMTPSAQSGEDNPDLFKEIIRYSNDPNITIPGNTPDQYNGNISQIEYQVAGYEAQAYSFGYDNLDRMTTANYADIHSPNWTSRGWGTSKYESDQKFQETATYDLRGNIITLTRKGTSAMPQHFEPSQLPPNFTGAPVMYGNFGNIDNLAYRYDPTNTNKLMAVTDNTNNLERGFKAEADGNNPAMDDYTYDDNGNITSDLNKGITNITYNYLNLPEVIQFAAGAYGSGRTIKFVYDASGVKLRKIVTVPDTYNDIGILTPGSVTTYDYVNGVEYTNGYLKRIAHTEGYVSCDGSTSRHEYVIKDHLGNARVTYTDANNDEDITVNEIAQVNHYYPFGLNMEGNWPGADGKNKYQYNEKEWNDDFGLGLNDYGARFYDPAIGRWLSIEPLAEQFYNFTPYCYALNSPILYVDKDGKIPVPVITGLIGAAGGLVYGLASGKSWEETAALTAGGFVAGATFSFISGGVIAVFGGETAIGASGLIQTRIYTGIASGIFAEVTEQGVEKGLKTLSANPTVKNLDEFGIVLSGVFGVLEVFGGQITETAGDVLKSDAKSEVKKATRAEVRQAEKEVAKQIREHGAGQITKSEAKTAAKKLVAEAQKQKTATLQGQIRIKNGAVDVSVSAINTTASEEGQDKIKN